MKIYTVTRIIKETSDVMTIQFVDKHGTHPSFTSGQYITVHFPDLDVAEGKAYSLSSVPSDPFMSITVKSIGPYSNRLCSLKPGDTMRGSMPYGFLYDEQDKPVVCIAGGVGISPLWSIMRSALEFNPARLVQLVHSNRTTQDIIFHDAVQDLAKQYASFKVTHHVTREADFKNKNFVGNRIHIPTLLATDIPKDARFVLCGTVQFVTDIYKALKSCGISDDIIATETFFGT
jgi:ring-1,2-phenylacetyl-CoA epoxidase subunit PaaE